MNLTELVNNIIENLENKKDLKFNSDYQMLIKLNNLIEKNFRITSKKNISGLQKKKLSKILNKKNEKKS